MNGNPVLDEIERWQKIYDWFADNGSDWETEATKVEGFLRHMIASTNINPVQPSPSETKQ